MTTVCYLLDEHVPHAIRDGLRRRWPEMAVHAVGDPGAPSRGTLDPDILTWCEEAGFILVTNNRASIPVHLRGHLANGRQTPGVFMLNADISIGDTIEELGVVWELSDGEEYVDRVSFLPVSE